MAEVVAAAATVPCCARATVQVVLPVPAVAVTLRISSPICTKKGVAGKPELLATVMLVCVALMGHASVVEVVSGLDRNPDHGETGYGLAALGAPALKSFWALKSFRPVFG